MYQNSDDFSEYSDKAHEIDYLHPSFYQQDAAQQPWQPPVPRSTQPVQSLEEYAKYPPYSEYTAHPDYSETVSGAKIGDNVTPLYKAYDPATTPEDEYTSIPDGNVQQQEGSGEQAQAQDKGKGKRRKGLAGLGGIGVTIAALLLKLKTLLVLLLNFKWLLFVGKFGLAGISALVSIGIYSIFFGWPFAIGLVVMLFLHEMGHAAVMKLKGIPMGGMIFVPLLGAAVTMRRMPQNARDEAEVGIAGPIAGALSASVCLAIAGMYPHTYTIWASLAYFGFFINLFNLIPIVPFDGGRVLAAIDRRVWIIGFLGLLAFQVWSWLNGSSSIWLLFFILMAATQLWSRNASARTEQEKSYYDVPIGTRITLGLLYFGLAAVLVLGMSMAHSLMPMLH